MKFRYGNFEHRENEAVPKAFIVRPRMSPRGTRISSIYEMHLQIDLTLPADGTVWTSTTAQAWFNTEIGRIVDGYSNNYGDAVFMHDDGTPTRHRLESARSISGVTVRHRTWPKGDGAEYATVRTGYVVLQAEYLELDSLLWEFYETVQTVGTTGRRWRFQERVFGRPVPYLTNNWTVQSVTQTGRATGVTTYPLEFLAPIYNLQSEHEDMRIVRPESPRCVGQGYMLYPIHWTYFFELVIPRNTLPRIV